MALHSVVLVTNKKFPFLTNFKTQLNIESSAVEKEFIRMETNSVGRPRIDKLEKF